MEDYRTILGSVFVLTIVSLLPVEAFAYEQKTHMGITRATAETYGGQSGSQKLAADDIAAMVQGSNEEDADSRPVNHFYDPIHERGLTVLLTSWESSKLWAEDTKGQAGFCIQYYFCSGTISYADKLFSSPKDYSWDRAIYEYTYGNKKRGLQGLGHILHLLQDATVPAHVRNDQHLNNGSYGDFDPYEQYASRYGLGDVPALTFPTTIPQRSSISAYINAVAGFTNGHFVSEDTLFTGFDYPSLNQLDIRGDGFGYDLILKNRVASVQRLNDLFQNSKLIVSLNDPTADPKGLVLSDSWSLLSKEAIQNGVGVMDLFFKSVEQEKKTHEIQKKNVSQQEIDAKNATLKAFSWVKKLYGSSLDQNDVSDLMGNQPAAVAGALSGGDESAGQGNTASGQEQPPVDQPAPKVVTPKVEKKISVTTTPSSESNDERSLPSVPQQIPLNDPQRAGIVGGGGSTPSSNDSGSNPSPAPVVVPLPIFTSPTAGSLLSTTSVTVSGTSGANATLTLLFTFQGGATSTGTTVASPLGVWNYATTTIDGAIQISATATDSNNNTSSASLLSFNSDITPPSVSTFSLLECAHSLATDACMTKGSAHPALSSTSSDVSYYSYIVDGTVTATTSTLGIITLSSGSHTVAIVAYDIAGNGATSSPVSIESADAPLVLNEIAWMGTPASPSDQWIELYNRSSHAIDLSQVTLTSSDGANNTPLSGTLAAGSYYLIEKSETTTSIASDLLVPALTLSSAPVQLSLLYTAGGLATSTIDETPIASACGSSWCAGTNDSDMRSMERTKTNVAGTLASNWNANNKIIKNGTDSVAGSLNATPKSLNSSTINSIGYTCNTNINDFYSEGGNFEPTSGNCRYYAPALVGLAHYGLVFAGTIGSSTSYDGHSMGAANDSIEHPDTVPAGYQVQGQDLFAAVVLLTPGPQAAVELAQFMDYFQTGLQPPPHNNYGVLRFKWGQ